MASFSFSWGRIAHYGHAVLQKSPKRSLALLVFAGLFSGCALTALIARPAWTQSAKEHASLEARMSQTKEAIAKLEKEKVEQTKILQKMMLAPMLATAHALNASGYSEDDVAYWSKQMALFGEITGIRLAIVGRAASQFDRATKLTVSVGSKDGVNLTPLDTVKALDFLQIYGYLESFDGKEAQVHIAPVPTSSPSVVSTKNEEGKKPSSKPQFLTIENINAPLADRKN